MDQGLKVDSCLAINHRILRLKNIYARTANDFYWKIFDLAVFVMCRFYGIL
jgi:hypothetical protein